MLRKNLVKEKLQRGEVVFGCMVLSTDPLIAEVLGLAGFDFLMLDGEHGSFDVKILENMVRACDAVGVVAFARLPVSDPGGMLPYLETGIMGVQIPHCGSKEDAARLVDAAKYSPIGKRGMGSGRVTGYAAIPAAQHGKQWNEEMMAIVQVEDAETIEKLPEILEVPGFDIIAIGLSDMANSMGHRGDRHHPDVMKAVAKMTKQIRDTGRWVSVAFDMSDAAMVKRYVDMGVQILKSGDVKLLRERSIEVLKTARSAIKG
jgi:4-hydroxy-2-oxoheptanedioate aldolase